MNKQNVPKSSLKTAWSQGIRVNHKKWMHNRVPRDVVQCYRENEPRKERLNQPQVGGEQWATWVHDLISMKFCELTRSQYRSSASSSQWRRGSATAAWTASERSCRGSQFESGMASRSSRKFWRLREQQELPHRIQVQRRGPAEVQRHDKWKWFIDYEFSLKFGSNKFSTRHGSTSPTPSLTRRHAEELVVWLHDNLCSWRTWRNVEPTINNIHSFDV